MALRPIPSLLIVYLTFSVAFFIQVYFFSRQSPLLRHGGAVAPPELRWDDIPFLHADEPHPLRTALPPSKPFDQDALAHLSRMSTVHPLNNPPSVCIQYLAHLPEASEVAAPCKYAEYDTFNEYGLPNDQQPPPPESTPKGSLYQLST